MEEMERLDSVEKGETDLDERDENDDLMET
jgi:hypothetical protein